MEASDAAIADRARRLWHRDLPKCVDIRLILEQDIPHGPGGDQMARAERSARIQQRCKQIVAEIEARLADRAADAPPILIDQARRRPYKRFQDSKTMLNQILLRHGTGSWLDMADISAVVASAETFEVCRAYVVQGDTDGEAMIMNIIRTTPEESTDVTL
jgi:uncharacterized protein